MTVALHGVDEVMAAAGRHLGYSDWLVVGQDRIDRFVEAVGSADYLVLSLSNYFLPQVVAVVDVSAGVNYGTEQVRFPRSLHAGDRVRAGVAVLSATEVGGGVQTTMRITMEVEGQPEPIALIDAVSRYLT